MTGSSIHRADQQSALLDAWIETRRQINALEARAADLLAQRLSLMDDDVADSPLHRGAVERSMIAEYSAAGRMAKGTVEHAFADARVLQDFPAVRSSFQAGAITSMHVRSIVGAAAPIQRVVNAGEAPDHKLALYEAAALEFAEVEAPARTRAHVQELAAVIAPRAVDERHRDALAEQRISIRPIDDEMSLLTALLPTHRAEAVMDRLNTMARHLKQHPDDRRPTLPLDADREAEADRMVEVITSDGVFTVDPFAYSAPDAFDPAETVEALDAREDMMERIIARGPIPLHLPVDARGIDQVRTELFTDLLLTSTPDDAFGDGLGGIAAHIQVTIAATTLIGADENPAQLDGSGSLHPDIARALAGRATSWSRLFLDADGLVTSTDTYVPTAGMRRFLRARDQHCRFPGCRMPVHRCQVDHTHDHALGGETSLDNLAHLCVTHHSLKHPDVPDAHRWTARQLPDWSIEWRSPNGAIHRDHVPRRVMFVPSGPESAPFDWNPPPAAESPF